MKLVIFAVKGSDTFNYLNAHDNWKLDDSSSHGQLSSGYERLGLATFIRAVDGETAHSLLADELVAESPTSCNDDSLASLQARYLDELFDKSKV
jgi:hypothetical protein